MSLAMNNGLWAVQNLPRFGLAIQRDGAYTGALTPEAAGELLDHQDPMTHPRKTLGGAWKGPPPELVEIHLTPAGEILEALALIAVVARGSDPVAAIVTVVG